MKRILPATMPEIQAALMGRKIPVVFASDRLISTCSDALPFLRGIPSHSIDSCITSPPYYLLRDFGTGEWVGGDPKCNHRTRRDKDTGHRGNAVVGQPRAGYRPKCQVCGAVRIDPQIGLEATPAEYVGKIVKVCRQIMRVLKPSGTLWLNLGDTYRRKELLGIPWLVAHALKADGWYLRSDIVWHKPDAIPETSGDRPSRDHEYLFLFSKRKTYFYNAASVKEKVTGNAHRRGRMASGQVRLPDFQGEEPASRKRPTSWRPLEGGDRPPTGTDLTAYRNRRTVWSIPTEACKIDHTATFPSDLIRIPILAGCPTGGVIIDPFGGTGTVAKECLGCGRKAITNDISQKWAMYSAEVANSVTDPIPGIAYDLEEQRL